MEILIKTDNRTDLTLDELSMCEFAVREKVGDAFVEGYFKNGRDMLDYIDEEKLLKTEEEPFPYFIPQIEFYISEFFRKYMPFL